MSPSKNFLKDALLSPDVFSGHIMNNHGKCIVGRGSGPNPAGEFTAPEIIFKAIA